MNREILFRGKRKDNSEWAEGYLLIDTISGIYTIVTYINLSGDLSDLSEINIFEVIPETVEQFTGLFDKNGTKLYEGDLIAFDGKCLLKIVYDNFGARAKLVKNNKGSHVPYHYEHFFSNDDVENPNFEIVGNIFDNFEQLIEHCPICGGEAHAFKDECDKFGIKCDECNLAFGITFADEYGEELEGGWRAVYDTLEDAVKAWNRRNESDRL